MLKSSTLLSSLSLPHSDISFLSIIMVCAIGCVLLKNRPCTAFNEQHAIKLTVSPLGLHMTL